VSTLSDCNRVAVKRSVMEIKAMYGITRDHYVVDDNVHPIPALHPAVEVRIDIEKTGVKLFIGSREYEWPRGCPDVCSVMTGSSDRSMGLKETICNLSGRDAAFLGTRMQSTLWESCSRDPIFFIRHRSSLCKSRINSQDDCCSHRLHISLSCSLS